MPSAIPPSEMFFVDRGEKPKKESKIKAEKEEKKENKEDKTEFSIKGSNRKIDGKYDIHFEIGSIIFSNLIDFINDIEYDAVLIFKKNGMHVVAVDVANTHLSVVKINKDEFLEYNPFIEKEDGEKIVYIDTSVITDDLVVRDNYPIDMYFDTLELNKFYAVCGKEIVEKQLNVDTIDRIKKHIDFSNLLYNLMKNKDYQKIVISPTPILNVMKSLAKKSSKTKGEVTVSTMYLTRHEVFFKTGDEVKKSLIYLSGEDIMVYPLNDDSLRFTVDYFSKLAILKLTYNVGMYVFGGGNNNRDNSLPLIFETKLGGGQLNVLYLVAPRVDRDDKL